jgi:hypothetical protein
MSDLLEYFWVRKPLNPSMPTAMHFFNTSQGGAGLNAMYKSEYI